MLKTVFLERMEDIIAHNADTSAIYKKGVNQFTDMTEAQFKMYRGKRLGNATQPCNTTQVKYPDNWPTSVDWRTHNPAVLTPIKNQGQCGSCWAFTTTEAVESALALATGKLDVLSPQNVVSCTPNPYNCGGSGGCNGAIAELGFEYIRQNGITTEAAWPYQGVTGTCTPHTPVAKVTGCNKLGVNNYTDLLAAVTTIGPIAVSVDASTWSAYSSGIFSGCDKENTMDIDHAVQLVGYGTENNTPYWIIRNSWGATWGEKGFIRLLRHADGSQQSWCKSDVTPQDGSGCDGGPSKITVCGECGIWYDNSYPWGAYYVN